MWLLTVWHVTAAADIMSVNLYLSPVHKPMAFLQASAICLCPFVAPSQPRQSAKQMLATLHAHSTATHVTWPLCLYSPVLIHSKLQLLCCDHVRVVHNQQLLHTVSSTARTPVSAVLQGSSPYAQYMYRLLAAAQAITLASGCQARCSNFAW